MKYRVTFAHISGNDDKRVSYDIDAPSVDEAFSKAYNILLDCDREREFTDATTEEVPEGPTNIGIRFRYTDNRSEQYSQYLFILANNEEQARNFYNKNIRGKKFYQPWPYKPDTRGNCIYGEIAETYFATGSRYSFDATKE